MWIEIDDEIWPDSTELVGVQFASAADFERAQTLLAAHPEYYRMTNPYAAYLVVRKENADLFAGAGLDYTLIELSPATDLSPEEEYQLQQDAIRRWMPYFIASLRQKS